jgi:hypothetical protein
LQALRNAVRINGDPVPANALVAAELVLPAENTSLDQVRALLAGEGLIPGVSGERTRFQPGRQMRHDDLACGGGGLAMAGGGAVVTAGFRPSSLRIGVGRGLLGACFVAIRAGLGGAPVLWFAALRALAGGVVLAGLGLRGPNKVRGSVAVASR